MWLKLRERGSERERKEDRDKERDKKRDKEREAFGIVGKNTILSIIFVLIQIS